MSEHIPAVEVKPEIQGSGLGAALFPQWLTKVATILVVLAGVALGLPALGIALPPVAIAICTSVVTLGAALGIASPGLRKKE